MESLLISAEECAAMCGFSEATWWRMSSQSRTPQPIIVSSGMTKWMRRDVVAFIELAATTGEWPTREQFNARDSQALLDSVPAILRDTDAVSRTFRVLHSNLSRLFGEACRNPSSDAGMSLINLMVSWDCFRRASLPDTPTRGDEGNTDAV